MEGSRLFDARLRASAFHNQDASNMSFFGVGGVVLSPAGGGQSRDADEALSRLEGLLGSVRTRLLAEGLECYALLGLHASWAPRRGRHKVIHHLPTLLRAEGVVGVGELGLEQGTPPEIDLLLQQLEIARQADLPVVLHFNGPQRYRLTALALDAVLESGFSPDRVLVAGVSADSLELVQAAGAQVGVTVGADPLGRARGVSLLKQIGPDGIMVDGGLGEGAGDLLSLPKALEELRSAGWSTQDLLDSFRNNATRFFALPSPGEADSSLAPSH